MRVFSEVKASGQVESRVSGPPLGSIQGKTYGQQEKKRGVCRALSDLKATASLQLC